MHNTGTEVLTGATIVKLTRTLAIIPITLVLGFYQAKKASGQNKASIKSAFPMFILYFIIASIITTFLNYFMDRNIFSAEISSAILSFFALMKFFSEYFIIMAMGAIGLHTDIVDLIKNSDIESFIKMVSNKFNLSDEDAVNIKSIYPTWEELIGKEIDVDTKLIYNDRLFKALVKHIVQLNWLPTDAATVYVEINEQNKGTVEDPIPYNGNMILYANKYYSQNNTIYKCIRDSVIPLYDSLNNLINIYVEVYNV